MMAGMAVFRRENQEPVVVPDSDTWRIDDQIAHVEAWLTDAANAESVRGSILDIGFDSRLNNSDCVVQGETIPLQFMRKLVELEITLWLSLYPPFLDQNGDS
jgi:hypothetical protein